MCALPPYLACIVFCFLTASAHISGAGSAFAAMCKQLSCTCICLTSGGFDGMPDTEAGRLLCVFHMGSARVAGSGGVEQSEAVIASLFAVMRYSFFHLCRCFICGAWDLVSMSRLS